MQHGLHLASGTDRFVGGDLVKGGRVAHATGAYKPSPQEPGCEQFHAAFEALSIAVDERRQFPRGACVLTAETEGDSGIEMASYGKEAEFHAAAVSFDALPNETDVVFALWKAGAEPFLELA
jgi:hypothetical protein